MPPKKLAVRALSVSALVETVALQAVAGVVVFHGPGGRIKLGQTVIGA
ncbi:MAG: hypothetical protein H6631_09200 [Anaerolineaceae bacterium]|nr:hypothetical protein [Anaerolineaceae bacterium]